MITDKEHLAKLVKYGVYFGYSTESIIQFIVDFDNAFTRTCDFRTHGETLGTGHICSTTEALTMSYDQIVENINKRRYCTNPFPDDSFNSSVNERALVRLYSSNFKFNKEVNKIIHFINENYDVVLEE